MAIGVRPIGTRGIGDNTGAAGAAAPTPSDQTIFVGSIATAEAVPGPVDVGRQEILVGSIASAEAVTGPASIGAPLVLTPKSIGGGEVVTGPYTITRVGTDPSPSDPSLIKRMLVKLFDSTYASEQLTLANDHNRTFRDPLNDAGEHMVSLQNDDAQLPGIAYSEILRYELDGIAVFSGLVESKGAARADRGEEAHEFTDVGGRGLIAEWEQAVWYPDAGVDRIPFVDTRIFNFACFDLDDSAWGTPIATLPRYFATTQNYGWPEGWPDNAAEWIWDRNNDGIGTPDGSCYFRREFTLASDVRCRLWCAADDEYEVWLDGGLLFEEDGFYVGKSQFVELDLDAGDHVIAVKVTNLNNLKAGLLFTMHTVDPDGTFGTVLTRSNTTTWKILAYPATEPGMMPGEIVRIFLEEAQARGVLAGWTLDFTDDVDSNGNPWTETADIAFPVGLDGLGMLRQLAETYVDVACAPGAKVLRMYNYGTMGQPSGVTLARGVNLEEYRAYGQRPLAKTALARFEQGYTQITNVDATIAAEAFLSVGQLRTSGEVNRVASAILDLHGQARTGAEFTMNPRLGFSETPWVHFFKGDTLTGPDESGVDITLRAHALAYAEDPEGHPFYSGELGDLEGLELEKIDRILRRMAGGTMGGRVESVSPPRAGGSAPPGETKQGLDRVSFPEEIEAGVISGAQTAPYALRIPLIIIRANTHGTGPSTFQFYIDNVHVPAYDQTFSTNATAEAKFVTIDMTPGQTIKVGIPTVGEGLADAVVELFVSS